MIDKIGVAFGEASTWRGIILIITALGINFSPEEQNAIISVGLSITGLIGVFTRRNSNG